MNSNKRIAATLYSLGTLFVSGIYVQIPSTKEIMTIIIIIITIIIIIIAYCVATAKLWVRPPFFLGFQITHTQTHTGTQAHHTL
jgi:flagellar basal body-associated protein FliL